MPIVQLPTLHAGQVRVWNERTRFNRVRCGRRWGKALALDTPIPTPSGWTTMGQLRDGDTVFDEKGTPCRVVYAHEVMLDRPCYEVEFSDGSRVIADGGHLWSTWTHSARKNNQRLPSGGHGATVITTEKIAASLKFGKRQDNNHSIPCTSAVQYPHAELMLDPYLLGAWLGDGRSDYASLTCGTQDFTHMIAKIRDALGIEPSTKQDSRNGVWCIGLTAGHGCNVEVKKKLRSIGVLNNKHVPREYLQASVEQRLALLQGMMDTDGSCYAAAGNCEFTSTSRALIDGAHELIMSLGIKATLNVGRAKLNGKDCGEKYRIKFSTDLPVFTLPRKLANMPKSRRFRINHRFIVGVRAVPSIPVRCITVDSQNSLYLCTRSFIPTHNTEFGKTIAGSQASKGRSIGWFAPDYKIQAEAYNELLDIITPIKKQASKIEGRMETTTGGRIDFWSLENERAGRSRKYHDVIIDEAAFTKPNMVEIWERSIKPTLFDLGGRAWVLSTPNGTAADNFFYLLSDVDKFGFKDHHAPTADNPLLPLIYPEESVEQWMARRASELQKLKDDNHPLVYQQEFLAEFVDWSGTAFFSVSSMLDAAGSPYDMPAKCDAVFAVVDTAIKTGSKNDGTGVTFYAIQPAVLGKEGRLIVLDWDIVQIEGSLLESWLPTVYERLEELATMTGARMGTQLGVFIEDKASGIILLQQAKRRGWNARAIDGRLTAMGKDERAISVSGYVYRGEVKICRYAYEKVKKYKEISRNHFLTQVTGFRIGVKDQADDLLDTFCYGISIALGNTKGY